MSDEMDRTLSVEHLLGSELAAAAGEILADARLRAVGPALAVQLATARGLLATYWELRRTRPGVPAMRESMVAVAGQRPGAPRAGSPGSACAEARALSEEYGGARALSEEFGGGVPVDHLLGSELAAAAEEALVNAAREAFDPVPAVQIATTQLLLALYWELRHQRPEAPDVADSTNLDVSLEWVSALLCSR